MIVELSGVNLPKKHSKTIQDFSKYIEYMQEIGKKPRALHADPKAFSQLLIATKNTLEEKLRKSHVDMTFKGMPIVCHE